MNPENTGLRGVEKRRKVLFEESNPMTLTFGLEFTKDAIDEKKYPELYKKLPEDFKVKYKVIGYEGEPKLIVTIDGKEIESEGSNRLVGREVRKPYEKQVEVFLEEEQLIVLGESKEEFNGRMRGTITISEMGEDPSGVFDSPLI